VESCIKNIGINFMPTHWKSSEALPMGSSV
jgi:hypothetical protein